MSSLIIPVGIPGSGKSTWVREVFPSAYIPSSDAIRVRLFGSLEAAHVAEVKEHNNKLVFETFHNELEIELAAGLTTVADATNLNREARAKLREIAGRLNAKTHLVFFQNVDQAVMRNSRRGPEDRVPAEAMAAMLSKYWDTMVRLPQEQYDFVTKISSVG